jgi:DMSO reductase anchor subunit
MSRPAGHGPLVAFTSLAIAGAGVIVAAAYLEVVHHHLFPPALVAGVLLQALGLAVSIGHLGQKRRAALAMRGVGRSALSNEVLFAPVALACGALLTGMTVWGRPGTTAALIAGVVTALFLLSIGLVYRVGGQKTWQGCSAFTPLTGGCAFGAVAIQSVSGGGGVLGMVLLLVVIDSAVFAQRWREVAAIRIPAASLTGSGMSHRGRLLGARFVLLDVLPLFLLLAWPTPLAAVVAAAGLLMDRVGFYALAVQHTTEHEVAAVEDLMTAGGQTRQKGSDSQPGV